MDGDMVDPPRDDADLDVDPDVERASEIDDITDSIPRPATSADDAGDGDAESAGGAVDDDVDYSDVDVAALLAEREQYREMAQRVQADFDNYRKRAAAQSLAEADRASGRLAEALLPVLDAAEAAYVRHPDEVGPLLNQMLTELKRHGLETLDLEGKPFDPEVAEAVAHEPGEGGEPMIVEVLRSGYTWKDKVLRAAMVKTRD